MKTAAPIDVMTKPEVAERLRISVRSIERLVGRGDLRPIRYPGINRDYFDRAEVDRFVEIASAATMSKTMPKKGSKWSLLAASHGLKRIASR